ncbi:MAG: Rpn family recombination-promoting nuclease/putative transposase [Eubacterium sp.]|nr:Rpn family recombination-promoting nuclease/putative transposase [Eubacterium sp.]
MAALGTAKKIRITNSLMFQRVMADREICREVLRAILPKIDVGEIVYLDTEKSLQDSLVAKGIRLDVYARGGDKVYNIEMQQLNTGSLPERSRYYQAQMDRDCLERGEDYDALRECYVIFICTFDPFGKGECVYHFEYLCLEAPELELGDGGHRIFINTQGVRGEITQDLKALLAYFENRPTEKRTVLVDKIDAAVEAVNRDTEWRDRMFTLEMQLKEYEKFFSEQGFQKGRREGIDTGENKSKHEIAERMLKKGMPFEEIAELTGLMTSEIEALSGKAAEK